MLKELIQDILEAIYDFLDQPNFRIMCINYHNQVKVEREIHEKLIKSTPMVEDSMEENIQVTDKDKKIIYYV